MTGCLFNHSVYCMAIFTNKLSEDIYCYLLYTQKKKFSQYLCFLIKSTLLDISLSNCIHELYYRNFTRTSLLCDK